jgi:HK97 family phage prohead protease
MTQIITFAAELTADSANRTISGKIVPLNIEAGSTNMGKVIFASGSIEIPDPKTIKLLNQHDSKKPLGRAVSFSESENSIDAVFSVSRSQRGTEALILAEEGLQSGLSIGAEVLKSKIKDGVTYVSAARLVEVSLVTEPAFKSAQVTDIAAEESAVEESTQPTESEIANVENTTPAVEATPVEAPAVEAARPTVTAMAYTKPRIEITAAKYAENTIRAALGDEDANSSTK